jgi:hypothetical protein
MTMLTKLFAAAVMAGGLTLSGVTTTGAPPADRGDCCYPGSPCCYPGSPCCDDDCCAAGAACCTPPQACCGR